MPEHGLPCSRFDGQPVQTASSSDDLHGADDVLGSQDRQENPQELIIYLVEPERSQGED